MKTAQVSPRQATAIASYILCTQSDAIRATNNKRSVTSTRITFEYDANTQTASVYSNYTINVVAELPQKYQALFA